MVKGEWSRHPLITGAEKTQDVIVKTAVLVDLGMTRHCIYERCRPSGPWRKLLPGVIQLSKAYPTPEMRMRAALLRAGPEAMVTGLWALRLHGLKHFPDPDDVHVLVPAGCHVSSVGFLLVERTTRLPSALQVKNKPVAPVGRAVLDGARRLCDYDAIMAMLADPIQRGICSPEQLGGELSQGSKRGSALPRLALLELVEGAHSVAEVDAQRLWKLSGLPECQRNVKLYDASGAYIATPDCWVDDVAFAWEIDSRAYHSTDDGYESTVARNARYAAAGIVVLQTLPKHLRTQPERVLAELKASYAAACRRPRPNVEVR
ncbi:hypothetical protein AB5J62_36765 [Amycolatopsis sp. cg5]|uniref:hypothetical protein n=1 Tax=Amycolatopsis sp. cg5 TaxID=3238802 RepID=UPI003523F7AE